MKDIMVIDGNLFARKMFYKFKHLSSKVSIKKLQDISPTYQKNLLMKLYPKEEKIYRDETGTTLSVSYGKIGDKIKQVMIESLEIKIKTGVSYGILRSLISLHEKHNMGKIIFCYDPQIKDRTGQYRVSLEDSYKSSREEYTDPKETIDFYTQLRLAQQILFFLGIKQSWTERFEADDLLQYYTRKCYKNNKCLIVTNDHDLFQILNSYNSIIKIGKSETLYTIEDFVKEHSINPSQWLDVMSLCGCNGDDVKGLPGIGETTAINLIREFGTIKDLLRSYKKRSSSSLTPKVKKVLDWDKVKNFSEIRHTRKLVKLYGFSEDLKKELLEKRRKEGGDIKKIIKILSILKFRSLLNKEQIRSLRKIIKNQEE